jgi:hypothetical protein
MSDTIITVIPDALNYYDNNNDMYSSIIDKISYYRRADVQSNTKNLAYTFYDDNDKEIFTSRVELIGRYQISSNDNSLKSWTWGWGIPITNKYFTNIIKKVFLYGSDIDVSTGGKISDDKLILKSELITSRFYVSNDTQVDIHCALASYLAKMPMVLSFANVGNVDKDDKTKFIYTKYDGKNKHTGVVYYMYILDIPDI